MEANFLKADVQGDMAVCPNCGHEGRLSSYIDGCDACGAKFLVSDFETKVSGFSLEEDAKQKSIFNFIKAGVTVGIVAVALALLAICAGGIMFLLLALGRNGYNAVKAATALGIYGIILAFSLVFMIHSEDGKETLAIWQSLGRSSEYLEAIQQDIVYPDDVLEGLTETDSEEGRFASTKVYACENSEVVKEAYKAALLKRGFLEMQQYPEGFSVFKIEDPSVYMTDEEEEMFYLVIRVENASEGITVTATLVDENWEPVQE